MSLKQWLLFTLSLPAAALFAEAGHCSLSDHKSWSDQAIVSKPVAKLGGHLCFYNLETVALSPNYFWNRERNHSRRSLFTYSQTQGLLSQIRNRHDLLVLKNGTLVIGEFEQLPLFSSSYGTALLDIDEIAFLEHVPGQSQNWKVQTYRGASFSGSFYEPAFNFTEIVADRKGGIKRESRKIAANAFRFIVFRQRKRPCKGEVGDLLTQFILAPKNATRDLKSFSAIHVSPRPFFPSSFLPYIAKKALSSVPEPVLTSLQEEEIPEITFIAEDEMQHEKSSLIASDEEMAMDTESLLWKPESDTNQEETIEFISQGDAERIAKKNDPRRRKKIEEAKSNGMWYVSPGIGCHFEFYIKKKRVSNEEYRQFVLAVNYKPPRHWNGTRIPPGIEKKPVVNVSYKDILLYCVWAGKRLPTAAELALTAKENRSLLDLDEAINEWTATPFVHCAESGEKGEKVKMGENLYIRHVIFGAVNPKPMCSNEYNSKTSFRLAQDVY